MSNNKWDAELYEARHGFVWQFGAGLVELLDPKPGERILDLGCGPGQLTAQIAEHGASVLGLDSSPDMIGQARQNFPNLHFVLQDATAMEFLDEFDGIFSNAALHWMLNAPAVAANMYRALRSGGRLVAEFGGHGNIQAIHRAIFNAVTRFTGAVPDPRNYFPMLGEYANLLEEHGFEVRFAHLYDRPTKLEGENGMDDWLRQFGWVYFTEVPASDRESAVKETVEALRAQLYKDSSWYADYRRLRIIAHKL